MPTAPKSIGARASGVMANLKNLNSKNLINGAKLPAAVLAGVGVGAVAQGFFARKGWKLPWNLDVRTVGGVIFLVGGAISKGAYADYYLAAGAGMIASVVLDATDGIVNKMEGWGTWLADKLSMKPAAAGYDEDGVGSITGKRRRLQRLENRIEKLQGKAANVASKLGTTPSQGQGQGAGRRLLAPPLPSRGGGQQIVSIPASQYRQLLAQAGY